VALVWGQDQQKAFDYLKLVMANPPVLRMAELSRTFILQTDEPFIALVAILLQDFDWSRKPTAYASRISSQQKLNSLLRNWSVSNYSLNKRNLENIWNT